MVFKWFFKWFWLKSSSRLSGAAAGAPARRLLGVGMADEHVLGGDSEAGSFESVSDGDDDDVLGDEDDGVVEDDHPAGPAVGRHDESAGRLPYLPDGVVVRPGSGGRRHRRGPESAPDPDPVPGPGEDAAATPRSVAPQSTEGLGLADLLAGALAAYRGI